MARKLPTREVIELLEGGDYGLEDFEFTDAVQEILTSGELGSLPGNFNRTAARLLEEGRCFLPS